MNDNKKGFPIWSLLFENLIPIIIIAIIFGSCGFVYSRINKSVTYTATKKIMVSATIDPSSTKTSSVSNNLTLTSMVMPTIATAFTSNTSNAIMNNYIDATYGTEPEKDIYIGSVSLNYSSSGLICSLSYSSASKDDAKQKLDYVISGFSYWLNEYKDMDIDIISTGTVSIMPVQKVATISQSSPFLSDVIWFAVVGVMFAVIFIIIRYILDTKVKCEQDIIDITGDGVLAFLEKY